MADYRNSTLAILLVGFGLAMLVLSWYFIPDLMNFIDDDFIKGANWIGFSIVLLGNIFILPYYLITANVRPNIVFKNAWQMTLIYMIGWLAGVISYYLVAPSQGNIINILISATGFNNAQVNWLAWLIPALIVVLLQIIMPIMKIVPGAQYDG